MGYNMEMYFNSSSIEDVEKLIKQINLIHERYSNDYFETGIVQKYNLKKTLTTVPQNHILNYRLNLHESINDYMIYGDFRGLDFRYRVKTTEAILNKIQRFKERTEKYPIHKWMNDIFGARIILSSEEFKKLEGSLDFWTNEFHLKSSYEKRTASYHGYHIYFQNEKNYFFPWELQIWDEKDVKNNIESHIKYKRSFSNLYSEQI